MLIHKAYKFQLMPNAQHLKQLSRFAGCNRLIWNKALVLQRERLEKALDVLSYNETAALLVEWKKEQGFLREVHSQPLQQTLKDLSRAFREHFKSNKGFPRFRKKGRRESLRFPQGFKVDGDGKRVFLPKIGWVAFRKSRDIQGTIKNITVSKISSYWYVSIQVQETVAPPTHPSNTAIGIDMGLARFASFSDGTSIVPVNSFRKLARKLALEQRKLARKFKFSQNWKKQKRKIQRVHSRIAHVRNDFLHKLTSEISKNHAIVALEDLSIRNMSRSATRTQEAPGAKVRAKAGLNKSILDQGWYEFRRLLTYKQKWLGGRVLLVSPVNTSRTCSKCKNVAAENRVSQAQFHCIVCGACENADLNAAKNILAAGLAVLACGDVRQVAV